MTHNRDRTQLPPLFRRHTRRPRLTGALDETTAQAIILNAPAGYGKTTLAQEWLQGRAHVAWYRATSASADLAAFSSGLADAVAPIVPGAGVRVKQRLRIGDSPDRAVRPLAELMASDLERWPVDGIIVVDDYHLVMESSAVEEFADWILTLVPVRVLVTTRRRPSWASARRVLYGEILELGAEQLAMSEEEATRVLGDRTEDAVRRFVRHAQGWPALIGLASLSASLELPEEGVSDALYRYFAEEVLRSEPPDVQRFMLLASIPATISEEIAREVLDLAPPETFIDHLKGAGILHEAPSGARLPPLLREFLMHTLERQDRDLFQSVVSRAIVRYRRMGAWEQAQELATRLDSSQLRAEVIADAAADLLSTGRGETLEKWMEACGSDLDAFPRAVIARAQLLCHKGHLTEAAAIAQRVGETLPAADPDAARAWLLAGRALHLISDDASAYECYRQARALAITPESSNEALWGLFLAANEVEPESASAYLDELESQATLDADTRLRLAVGRQALGEQKGTLAGLWPRYAALVPLVSRARDPMTRSSFLANSAAVNIGRGHYELAHSLASQGLALCADLRLDFALGPCLSARCAAEIGMRKFAEARRTLSQLQASPSVREDPHFQVSVLTLRAKLALARQEPVEALATLEELRYIDAPKRALGEHLGIMAIAQAITENLDAANATAAEALDLVSSVEAIFYSRYASFVAHLRSANSREAPPRADDLAQLIAETVEAEFLDGLVVAYRAEPTILKLMASSAVARQTTHLVLKLAHDETFARSLGIEVPRAAAASRVQDLTPREAEVLELMCEGLSNRTIAARLFISESTAKVHVHHILVKLGVETRLQAVVRATEAANIELS